MAITPPEGAELIIVPPSYKKLLEPVTFDGTIMVPFNTPGGLIILVHTGVPENEIWFARRDNATGTRLEIIKRLYNPKVDEVLIAP